MAGGCAARGRDRGGEGIQTVRPARARVAARVAAAVVAAALGAWLAADAGAWGWALAAPAAGAFVLVCARSASALPWALALLGAEYAGALAIAGHARTDGRAPLVAAGLVAIAELAAWARELALDVPQEREVLTRRAVRLAFTTAAAGAVGAAVLTLAAAPLDLGLAGDALGVAAAVGALGLVARLARR